MDVKKPQEVPLFRNNVPWMLAAGALGGLVVVAAQRVVGADPFPVALARDLAVGGPLSPGRAARLAWALHIGIGFQWATVYAVFMQLPWLETGRARRFAVGLLWALALGWLAGAVAPPATAVVVSLLRGTGLPAALPPLSPGLGANFWLHQLFFLLCWLLVVVAPGMVRGEAGDEGLTVREMFVYAAAAAVAVVGLLGLLWPGALLLYFIVLPLVVLGVWDMTQTSHSIQRNFPVIGHLRYLMEAVRPEIQQYFVESDLSGRPFSRDHRSVVYQRAKGVRDTEPFGTQRDVYVAGYQWINHSLRAKTPPHEPPRVMFGQGRCAQPYGAALLNVSAMSYGALSPNAIMALNEGAKLGGFAHNTGEGGLSPYHEQGGDLIWQVGTAYFGCRDEAGRFSPAAFAQKAKNPAVKMIEIKLSQGAKPGHGGILPAKKLTPEIARIRAVPLGRDVLSPPCHSAFDTPIGLMQFIAQLRELSGGKPVGFKLCVGGQREFFGLVKAMLHTGLCPDFITVDGGEGGTGAAPMEFANSVGTPLDDGLVFVHNALLGAGLRDRVRLIASGKIVTGFHLVHKLALGADTVNSARAMMMALGCIQALKCNTNECPVGVATQNPKLVKGLVVGDKARRVASYQQRTVHAALEIVAAAGLDHPWQVTPDLIHRRTGPLGHQTLAQLYPFLQPGQLLGSLTGVPPDMAQAWQAANPAAF